MEGKIIVFITLIVALAGVLGFIYYKYQPTQSEEKDLGNISISAESNGKKIKTGLLINGQERNTSEGYELVRLKKGQLIQVENINLENQYFYKDKRVFNLSEENVRLDLELKEPKPLQIQIIPGNPTNITVFSEDFRDLVFCLTWSLNYIFVNSNYTQIDKIKGYENWDKCYSTRLSLLNSKIEIPVNYQEFGIITEKDYINISLMTPEFINKKDVIEKIK
jgi:hypothetical protein